MYKQKTKFFFDSHYFEQFNRKKKESKTSQRLAGCGLSRKSN